MKEKIVIAVSILLPFLFATVWLLWFGNLIFWYDPARDLLSAWDNFSKPTLIGPPSGIPGIFYGAYWIWLLSFGQLFSKDPLMVTFITATLPYFIIFPFIWFKFARFFDRTTLLIGWILFITGSTTGFFYATQLWNPHPAPLLTLAVLYLLIRSMRKALSWKEVFRSVALGLLLGILITFHISFGIALALGIILFLLGDLVFSLIQKTRRLKTFSIKLLLLTTTGIGVAIAFLPTLLFEIRHGFTQTQTLLQTFSQFGAVVETKGLSKGIIFMEFFNTLGSLLHVPAEWAIGIALALLIAVGIAVKKRAFPMTGDDKRVALAVIAVLGAVALIYFTARNPVWAYHFIGVEIPLLIGFCFIINKLSLMKKAALVLTGLVIVITGITWYSWIASHKASAIEKQQAVVQTVAQDAQTGDYTVFTYSPSIYSYEYSYLFRWLADKEISYDPGQNPQDTQLVYLIVPVTKSPEIEDFINYRGNKKDYNITTSWKLYNDVEIIKKTKKDNL